MAMKREVSGIMFSYYAKSEYHDRCIPQDSKAAAAAATGTEGKRITETEKLRRDPVTYDRVWKQSVGHEKNGVKQWDENWGFMAEYDERGEKKEKEELPEKTSFFSDTKPNTNAGNYGSRVTSETGQAMQRLEFNFHAHNRRKKLDGEITCY